jgi:hypothetical protein
MGIRLGLYRKPIPSQTSIASRSVVSSFEHGSYRFPRTISKLHGMHAKAGSSRGQERHLSAYLPRNALKRKIAQLPFDGYDGSDGFHQTTTTKQRLRALLDFPYGDRPVVT